MEKRMLMHAGGSGYLDWPYWLPTEEKPRRHVDWPTGLEHTMEYEYGDIRKVRITTDKGRTFCVFECVSDYAFTADDARLSFKKGTLLTREDICGVYWADAVEITITKIEPGWKALKD